VAAALDIVRTAEFDLLLSDLGPPDGSGLELVGKVRAMRPMPALALSGFGMEEDIVRCKQAGFDAHLTKPVNFQKLEAMIFRLTGNGTRFQHEIAG